MQTYTPHADAIVHALNEDLTAYIEENWPLRYLVTSAEIFQNCAEEMGQEEADDERKYLHLAFSSYIRAMADLLGL